MPAVPAASTSPGSAGIAVFEPARFERLHRIINEAASNPVRLARSNDWFVTIDRNRSDLADLGRVRPSSDLERKEIESGKITINGSTQNLNPDFAQQSLLLARELGVSEHYAASLLQQGIAGRAKWGRPAVEVACILHHRERLALLACLKELLRNALTMPFEDDVEAQRMGLKMEQLVESLVSIETSVSSPGSSTRKVTLAERILVEIDNVKASAARVKASLESPQANQAIQTQTSNSSASAPHSRPPTTTTQHPHPPPHKAGSATRSSSTVAHGCVRSDASSATSSTSFPSRRCSPLPTSPPSSAGSLPSLPRRTTR